MFLQPIRYHLYRESPQVLGDCNVDSRFLYTTGWAKAFFDKWSAHTTCFSRIQVCI